MASELQDISATREALRRTISTCSTRMKEREREIRRFRGATRETGKHLAAAMHGAEQAMEQVKEDHQRAATETGELGELQRQRRKHMDSLAAQRAATNALQDEVERLRTAAKPAPRLPAEDEHATMKAWFLMPAARVVHSSTSTKPSIAVGNGIHASTRTPASGVT